MVSCIPAASDTCSSHAPKCVTAEECDRPAAGRRGRAGVGVVVPDYGTARRDIANRASAIGSFHLNGYPAIAWTQFHRCVRRLHGSYSAQHESLAGFLVREIAAIFNASAMVG
jgi:hypothetical protein